MPDQNDNPTSPAAGPQRIRPTAPSTKKDRRRGGNRGWIVASTLAVVGVLAALGVTGFVIARTGAQDPDESRVRNAVDTFAQALDSGNLGALQSSTCGTLANFYRDIPPTDFAGVHRDVVAHGGVPVVTSVDTVQITGDTAIAQVTAHTEADPSDASPRTLDLERVDGTWKVCDRE
ncbi:hypothetical protein [Prescottella equi]|uniref:Rv0361 family membrane protein n=1 Tax=Rhodococcus hoagii TaxID=43767 RepID=UPI000A117E32|nr:hypothetical protein [Prescottella equi]NKR40975.1 hypothetical protein [Prescottella equi]NKR73931.1 hypothetical protein [Prescottella equi]NKT44398.1 hypothetical protein [Prescottella equi]ORL02428.1 hypothetical protein A6F55_15960 [Prescottella equi]ORL13672.1 hypothetical protein A6I85_09245 [Prescottella equi]